jgi:hypothetical protein
MPYHISRQGSSYNVVVDATGKVVGRHSTKAQAQAQLGALYSNVPEASSKTLKCLSCLEKGQGPCWDGYQYAGTKEQNGKTVPNCIPAKKAMKKLIITGGSDWSIEFGTPDCQHGWSITKGGTAQSIGCYLTKEEAEKALEGLENKEVNLLSDEVRTSKTPEEYAESHVNKCLTCGCGDMADDHGEDKPTMEYQPGSYDVEEPPFEKADGGYKPNAGMKSAAAKAIKWKEDGKANGAGTNVGWTRAHQIVNGESLSLDTVKRMYSFFSRHEVDKQGKDWDKPSHGKVMWYAWGGDAGYSWSRAIVERESKMKKSIWDGVFVPTDKGFFDPGFNSTEQDATYYFPSKASYENDGKPSVGYGNRSSNDSIPEGNNVPDKTTKPGRRTWG